MSRKFPDSSAPITEFKRPYEFLSNFSRSNIHLAGRIYPTVEHAFQAAKTLDPIERADIQQLHSPGDAKRYGQKVTLRKDWEDIKEIIMLELLREKFSATIHPRLAWNLADTGQRKLYEGNNWKDRYWGCDPVTLEGKNRLGILLMLVRDEVNEIIEVCAPKPT
jgi:ribA/ribD-fused uncharacterized protein